MKSLKRVRRNSVEALFPYFIIIIIIIIIIIMRNIFPL